MMNRPLLVRSLNPRLMTKLVTKRNFHSCHARHATKPSRMESDDDDDDDDDDDVFSSFVFHVN